MTTLPDVIDSEFLNRSDVFAMDAATPGVGGNLNRWPDEVINPITNGLQFLLFDINVDYSSRGDGNLNDGILAPREGGIEEAPVYFVAYDATSLPFDVSSDHPSDRAAKATLGQVQLNNFSPYSPNYTQLHGLSFKSFVELRARFCVINKCEWNDIDYCVRIRSNGSDNIISNNICQRFPPFSTTSDRVAILLSDGTNLNNIISGNTILNYTDGVQLEDNNTNPEYGTASGTVIYNNYIGITSEAQLQGGLMEEGLENAIDLKVAGTECSAVIIKHNVFFGFRQNSRSPGYAINIKRYARHINIVKNTFSDIESGIFFNAQHQDNNPTNPWILPEVQLNGNTFLEIRDNGAGLFPEQAGRVFVGSNVPSVFQDNVIAKCDYLAEQAPNVAAGAWPFDPKKSNKLYEPITQGGLAWPEQIIDTNGNGSVQIPYTRKTVQVSTGLSDVL